MPDNRSAVAHPGIVILAAGASTRLGTPKQLITLDGSSLIERAIRAALDSGCSPVVVVLGAHRPEIESVIPRHPTLHVEYAADWATGMSASIRAGVTRLLALAPAPTGVLLMLCDQPGVTGSSLQRLLEPFFFRSATLVASSYQDRAGVPALFGATFFGELLQLQGTVGARKIIEKHLHEVVAVPMPEAALDVDTSEDVERLRST